MLIEGIGTQITHVSKAISRYDVPMASANTFNRANVCFGLAISGHQPQELDG